MREQNRILVLYGSQTFTAQEVAERVWRKTKALGFRGPVQAMDDYPISRLIHENFVIFVCSTTGQGDEPDNMKKFWKFLLRKSLPPNSLMTLRFGVVGLGDSSYEKFNFAGKKLHKRLKQLGATPLLDIGLCDYQHDLGHDAVLTPWLDQLFIKLKCYFPNLQTDNMNDTFIPKWKVSIIKKEIPVVLDSEYEDIYFARGQKSYYLEANLLKVTKNMRTTEETHFQFNLPATMDKKRSKLWGFFTQTKDDKAKCDLCHSLYSVKGGSTTNLKKHLMKKHRSSYETIIPCSMSDEAVLEAPIPSTSASTESTNPVIKKSETISQQTKLSAFIKRPVGVVREKKINDLIFKMIVKDLQPFSVIEYAGFKDLINYLEPGYKMPSRYILSNTLLDAQYSDVQKKLKEELESAKYVSITTDGWTSRATTSYQAVTAHYLLNWELKSALLGCFECHERHTAEYIKNELYSLLLHWSIQNKIFVCVTDNAANMKAAIRLTTYEHLPCIAHTVNLVVRAGLQDCGLGELIKKIKAIVEHFHKSSIANKKLFAMQEQLRPNQKPLKLKMDVVTRWNSTLDMIERICLLQEPLEASLGILHNPVENLSEGEWQTLPEIIKILKPFKQLTEEMSSEKNVTVSMVLASTESIIRIFHSLDTNIITDTGKKLANKIITEFKSRFKNCYRHPVLSKAALLDPRFKKLAFRFDASSYESAKDALKTELQNEFNFHKQSIEPNENESTLAISTGDTDADNDSIWKDFDSLAMSASASNSIVSSSIITMRQYLEERIIPRNECPLKWWQARAILYPELSNLAEKYLSVMATSVPSERTFSKSGQILSERRSSIQPKRMEKILFLNMNQRFLP